MGAPIFRPVLTFIFRFCQQPLSVAAHTNSSPITMSHVSSNGLLKARKIHVGQQVPYYQSISHHGNLPLQRLTAYLVHPDRAPVYQRSNWTPENRAVAARVGQFSSTGICFPRLLPRARAALGLRGLPTIRSLLSSRWRYSVRAAAHYSLDLLPVASRHRRFRKMKQSQSCRKYVLVEYIM